MAIKRVKNGYQVDIRPQGRSGPRLRQSFPTKLAAERWEKNEMAKGLSAEYIAPVKDRRSLSDFANLWFELKGHKLKSGRSRLGTLLFVAKELGDPHAKTFDKKLFMLYQERREQEGITRNHLNHELVYFKSVFNTLKKLNEWEFPNPFNGIDALPFSERVLSFLSFDETERFLIECESSNSTCLYMIAKICLSTGCRWGEAQSLRGEQIHSGQIHFTRTKTLVNRSVPISKELELELFTGRPRRGKLFKSVARTGFEKALERAKINLPKGQLTHVLRHTYASHFVMSGGNLVDLNKILGHKTLQMTMRYAHLSPGHLIDAIHRSPLKLIENHRKGILKIPSLFFGGHIVDTLNGDENKLQLTA